MLTIAIDCGDQRPKGHTSLYGDLLQTVPELVFKADAGLVSCNDNRALRNQRLHGLSPQMSHVALYGRMALRPRSTGLRVKSCQPPLNLSGASAVYRAVDCRLRWPR